MAGTTSAEAIEAPHPNLEVQEGEEETHSLWGEAVVALAWWG